VSDKVYRIKPLVWKKREHGPRWIAKTIFGDLIIDEYQGSWPLWHKSFGTRQCRSLDDAQLAAEQWYRERMAAGLVEITNDKA
jgi:hypothetical protein